MSTTRTPAWAAALVARMDALEGALVAPASSPRKPKAKAKARTFATLAERQAGAGFACSCGRTDLRVAVHAGSFHKAPDGTTVHTIE